MIRCGRTGCGEPTGQQRTAPRANDGEAVLVGGRGGGRGGDAWMLGHVMDG